MKDSKKGFLHMQHGKRLSKIECPSSSDERERTSRVPYANDVVSIMYAMKCTRPNAQYALCILIHFQDNSSDSHWTPVKNILKYLRKTKDMFMVYGGKNELRVTCYTYTRFQIDRDNSSSHLGWEFLLN